MMTFVSRAKRREELDYAGAWGKIIPGRGKSLSAQTWQREHIWFKDWQGRQYGWRISCHWREGAPGRVLEMGRYVVAGRPNTLTFALSDLGSHWTVLSRKVT